MNWSQYIEEDLHRRLAGNQPLPCEPTLQRLAMHYGVSTRPVRIALRRLEEMGLWSRQGRRRGRVTDRAPAVKPRRERAKLTQTSPNPPIDYYEAIGRELVTRSLEGRETFLREQAMARQFDVSTTTVREAFHRLAGEGIIEHVPRRGWRLRPHAQKDMDDFVAVRQALEALALVCGWEATQSPDGRTVMEGFLARNTADGNPGGSPQIDDGFHAWIVEAAGNRYIRDILTRFGRYYRFLFEWEAADRAAGMQTVQQHRRILEAILQGDMPRARAALEAHLRYEHPLLKRVMKLPQLEIET